MGDTYTVIKHGPLDSAAGRLLSGGAFRVLFDFTRAWEAATCKNGAPPKGIRFSWTGSPWPVRRQTWRAYRDELMARGFLVAVTLDQGIFAPSDGWRKFVPGVEEVQRLEKHSEFISGRVDNSRGYRGRKTSPVNSTPKASKVKDHRGRKTSPVNTVGGGTENVPCDRGRKPSPIKEYYYKKAEDLNVDPRKGPSAVSAILAKLDLPEPSEELLRRIFELSPGDGDSWRKWWRRVAALLSVHPDGLAKLFERVQAAETAADPGRRRAADVGALHTPSKWLVSDTLKWARENRVKLPYHPATLAKRDGKRRKTAQDGRGATNAARRGAKA